VDETVTKDTQTATMQTREGYKKVTKMYTSKGKVIREDSPLQETIFVRDFLGTSGKVSINLGMTLSLGEGTYEFVRVDVGVELPCYPEELKEAKTTAYEFAKSELFANAQEVREKIPK